MRDPLFGCCCFLGLPNCTSVLPATTIPNYNISSLSVRGNSGLVSGDSRGSGSGRRCSYALWPVEVVGFKLGPINGGHSNLNSKKYKSFLSAYGMAWYGMVWYGNITVNTKNSSLYVRYTARASHIKGRQNKARTKRSHWLCRR